MARDNPEIWEAMRLSTRVALLATLVSLVLGSLAAAAVARSQFDTLDISFGTFTIVMGHATICVVIVYNNVLARLRRTSGSIIEASMDLGASGFQTFRYVLLPTVGTALLAGSMLAFALSFDEIIVTTFTAGNQKTLPIWILGSHNRQRHRPVLNVVAIAVMAITLVPVMIAQRLAGKEATRRV